MSFYSGIDLVSSREDLERRSDSAEADLDCVKTPTGVGAKPVVQWRSGQPWEWKDEDSNREEVSRWFVSLFLHADSIYCRYYAQTSGIVWPPEIRDYNAKFTKLLEDIKRRHDPTVTTVAQGVLEWKRTHNARKIDNEIQAWLDRFYLSRIGIRFLLGQRTSKFR